MLLWNYWLIKNHMLPPTPTSSSFCCLILWLDGLSCHIWCAILLNDTMDLHMSSLGTLIPGGLDVFFYATRHQVYWCLVFCWYCDSISHTHTKTQHSRSIRLTHPYKNIFTPPVMCSEQLCLLQWMNKSLVPKVCFLQCIFFPIIIHL